MHSMNDSGKNLTAVTATAEAAPVAEMAAVTAVAPAAATATTTAAATAPPAGALAQAGHALPPDLAAIQSRFIAARGYWRPWTDALLHANPAFLSHYANYAGYPARTGPLTPRMIELIYVALDASATHLYEAGLSTHLDLARKAGATEADIFDVLHVVTCQGLSAVLQAADLLHEAVASTPMPHDHPIHQRIAALWPDQTQRLLRLAALDPGYVSELLDFIEGGRPAGGLTDAERLLVRIALHACFTDRDEQALRALIPHALARGTPSAEILQAIQLGAHLSVHGAAMGATTYAKRAAGAAAPTRTPT